jgi:hypothetical protein
MSTSTEREQWANHLDVPVDADGPTLCEAFEPFAREVLAPIDLAKWPFYAVAVSTLPADFTTASRHANGWFHTNSYHWVQPYRPRDLGPGPVLFITDIRSPESRRHIAKQMQQRLAERGEHATIDDLLQDVPTAISPESICRTLTHELAHALDNLADGSFSDNLEILDGAANIVGVDRVSNSLDRKFDDLVARKQHEQTAPPFDRTCHGLRFTRIMAHLDVRLQRHGVQVARFFDSENYGLPEFSTCRDALGDEPTRCLDESFVEILDRPLPVAFKRIEPLKEKETAA